MKKGKDKLPGSPFLLAFRTRPANRFLLLLLILFVLYAVWLSLQLVRFQPLPGASLPPGPGALPPAISSPPYEIQGVYHIHTRHSDGRSSPSRIARIASRLGLDFLILTDHGNPNLASINSQGWREGVLALAGSELSVSRGHLAALGFTPPRRPFSQNAEEAAREIQANGGFSVIAHPFAKVHWSWGDAVPYGGIEIMDTDTMFKKNFLATLPYLPALLFRPRFYLLKTLEWPGQTLRKWDELNQNHTVYGYFSADAHLLYGVLLAGFHLHVLLDEPLARDFEEARQQVFEALRRGRFYNAIDAAGEADGFRFAAEVEASGLRFPMGAHVPADFLPGLRLEARLPSRPGIEMRLIHNARVFRHATDPVISALVDEPGVYRVEVYIKGRSPLDRDVPWIVSNPIFVGKESK